MADSFDQVKRIWTNLKGHCAAQPAFAVIVPPERCAPQGCAGDHIRANDAYFTLRIHELHLSANHRWHNYDPMVLVVTEFNHDGQRVTVPCVVGPNLIRGQCSREMAEHGSVVRDTRVAGPYPYRGGDIEVSVSLFQVERDDYAKMLLRVIERLSDAIGSALHVGMVAKTGAAMLEGVEGLLGLKGTMMLAGYRLSLQTSPFDPLKTGVYALIAPPVPRDTSLLVVRERRLQLREGCDDKDLPYRASDYVLLGIDASDLREDGALASFEELKADALNALWQGADGLQRAKGNLITAYQQMRKSADITSREADVLFNRWLGELDEELIRVEQVHTMPVTKRSTQRSEPWSRVALDPTAGDLSSALRQLERRLHRSTGSGAIAQEPRGVEIGAGGAHVDGQNAGSINTGTQVNTAGGVYVGGNVKVRGDFVGRDQITRYSPREDSSPDAVSIHAEDATQSRQVRVTGHSSTGETITAFAPRTRYALQFCVAGRSEGNLARGEVDMTSVPHTGLAARWIVSSANVELLAVSPIGTIVKRGDTWLAEFDLAIPGHGDSAIVTLDICTTDVSGELNVTLLVSGEEYRKLAVTLGFGAHVTDDIICTAPGHLSLGTCHEWTTPPEHLEVNVFGQAVRISTIRGTKDFGTMEWVGNSALLKNPIDRVRRALEKFRVAAEAHLNDLDVADMDRRLHTNHWKPYDWGQIPVNTTHQHVLDFLGSGADELRALANEGYRLFDTCFPRDSGLRSIIENLKPGSRLDFVWTSRGAVDWVSHVPWALMYLDPVKLSEPVDCERFLGLRYRIGSKSWEPNAPSAALGDPAWVHALHFLYWGTDPRDEVAAQSLWQRNEFGKRARQWFLPEGDIRDFKRQLVAALETPKPDPAGILYFYCHCSVKDGSDPVLQFGESAKSSDIIEASDIYSGPLEDGPLVFANACTTAAADPLGTSELESRFFARNIRAFLGTETKVPVVLASRFAWLFFQFFFRSIDPSPMAAGEALAQARRFLWTQYHNPGGLFYCLVNRYDLYLASDEEVAQLQRR